MIKSKFVTDESVEVKLKYFVVTEVGEGEKAESLQINVTSFMTDTRLTAKSIGNFSNSKTLQY